MSMRSGFSAPFPLRRARVHEVSGAGATVFAAIAAASASRAVLWLQEAWVAEKLNPEGLLPFLEPSRLLLVRTQGQIDTLAAAEEALRDASVGFVTIEVTRSLSLREGRKLQLAAKAGGTTGLCIIPEGMGSNAAETRWRAAPKYDPQVMDLTLMHWELNKNKSGTIGDWHVRWDQQTHRLHVVSPACERPDSADAPH